LLGKIDASLDKKLDGVEWGEYEISQLFTSSNGDFDIQKEHLNEKGLYVVTSGVTNNGILGKTDIESKIFDKNTITVDMFGYAFFRNFQYKMVTHARVFSLKPKFNITSNQGLFLANSLHFLHYIFGYENMCSWEKIKKIKIFLPIKENKIDFDFMEAFVNDLEKDRIRELEEERTRDITNYLKVSEIDNYELTIEEEQNIKMFKNIEWKLYNLEELFGKSTRGKRLKSADRIPGDLPFVTAGEANEGISDFIGNNVHIFSNNTITIDMFGSAKYRNYKYGGDDHIAVVHTERLSKNSAIFVTTAIHKAAHNGQFDYSRNFYAKDADNLEILLPSNNGSPDFEAMENIISAVHKMVIKDVILNADKKIEATKYIVNKC